MDKNNFNARFRLFLESIEEERQLNELAGSGDEMDFNTMSRGTASSSELAAGARNAASSNAFSGNGWTPNERNVYKRTVQMFQYMIEQDNIMLIVPELQRFFQQCFRKLDLKLPGSQEAEAGTKPGAGSLSVGGKSL